VHAPDGSDGGLGALKGEEIATLGKNALRRLRRHMQIIFQDPYRLAQSTHDGGREFWPSRCG